MVSCAVARAGGGKSLAQIEYITGNLLDSNEKLIVHGCNAHGVMGSGIAIAIRDKWPQVYDIYREHYEEHIGEDIMGEIVWAMIKRDDGDDLVVANAITQKNAGRDKSVRYCSYDAIDKVFKQIDEFVVGAGFDRVGMPLIGAGLANGSWKVISAIIEANSTNYTPVVYLLDGVIPKS
jgi:O-acetyl-ADP-ribose deacetylase (regulator of RNase III)